MKMSAQKNPVKPSQKSASNGQGPEFSDRAVYFIGKQSTANIVDIVLKLMDGDGPTPMKNLKPAKKNRTGADQFYLDHHAEYEARGKVSRDKVARVLTHNSACPKMYDELKKRRSTSKPVTGIQHRNLAQTNFDQNYQVCVKLKKQAKLESRKKRTRTRSNRTYSQRQPRDNKTKVTKPKRPQRRARSPSRYKLSRIRLNKCCQCTSYCLPTEKKSVSTFKEFVDIPQEMVAINNFANSESYDPKQIQMLQKSSKHNSKCNVDPGTRETSAPSVSSYNSYMSMDHEPMVE